MTVEMATAKLGKLERVDVRKAWPHEAHDFTPWLAESLDRLGDELGFELEFEGRGVHVGPYRADIVARVPQTDDRVLIENQLEKANLQHLGQVLAYLAGLEAKIVVWIAKGFQDEHLSAIRWLNEHTLDLFAFFAVRVGVVQIGASPLAPVFDVLERPNEWDRNVQKTSRSGELSGRGDFQREFWAHCLSRWKDRPKLRPDWALPNIWHKKVIGTELRVVQYVSSKGVGVYVGGRTQDEDKSRVEERIQPYSKSFAKAMQGDAFLSGKNSDCRTVLEIDTRDRDNWDIIADWLDNTRRKYEEILRSVPGSTE
ncbi:MAG: hypothetical protein OXF55_14595 [Caldilineaceae bacterium]|nr:hypothetical protein [Caldilineaceae bacterium]